MASTPQLDDETLLRLSELAKASGRPIEEVLKEALDIYEATIDTSDDEIDETINEILNKATHEVEEKYPNRVRIKQLLSKVGPSINDIRVELREL